MSERPLRAVIHMGTRAPHHRDHAAAIAEGLTRHGVSVTIGSRHHPEPCDVAVVWGARQGHILAAGRPVLIMERGHVGDRMRHSSLGWNGLARRGRYPTAQDGGARWRERYGHLMHPWTARAGYALVLGQVDGDAALTPMAAQGLDVLKWAGTAATALFARGWDVRFRPHPLAEQRAPAGVPLRDGSLAEALDGAGLCVTYNSTSGVEAVLAGVPTVTLDPGAMAWPVTTHDLDAAPVRPDREAWAADLAWTQWTLPEIASGEAWAALAPLREG